MSSRHRGRRTLFRAATAGRHMLRHCVLSTVRSNYRTHLVWVVNNIKFGVLQFAVEDEDDNSISFMINYLTTHVRLIGVVLECTRRYCQTNEDATAMSFSSDGFSSTPLSADVCFLPNRPTSSPFFSNLSSYACRNFSICPGLYFRRVILFRKSPVLSPGSG